MSIQSYLDTYLTRHGVSLDTSSDRELMYALTAAVRDLQKSMGHAQGKRKLYYFSAEFLVGRLLRANLINLGLIWKRHQYLGWKKKRVLPDLS